MIHIKSHRSFFGGNQAGLTLIELIIAITLMATVVTAITGFFISIGTSNKRARDLATATAAAQERIEIYRNKGYVAATTGAADFTSELPASLGSPKTATAIVTELSPGLKNISIAITYTEDGRSRRIEVATMMTERGINK